MYLGSEIRTVTKLFENVDINITFGTCNITSTIKNNRKKTHINIVVCTSYIVMTAWRNVQSKCPEDTQKQLDTMNIVPNMDNTYRKLDVHMVA